MYIWRFHVKKKTKNKNGNFLECTSLQTPKNTENLSEMQYQSYKKSEKIFTLFYSS